MSSDPNCVPETRVNSNGLPKQGACSDSRTGGPGYRNLEGFPPCCDLYSSSDGTSSWMSNRPGSRAAAKPKVQPSVQQSVQPSVQPGVLDISKAAAGCVAKNPNYPSVAGSCVYNPQNPCVGNYETTDTRFGTKMCCAPKTPSNAACFPQVSNFGKSNFGFGKSNFGFGGNNICIMLLLAVLIYFVGKKYKWF